MALIHHNDITATIDGVRQQLRDKIQEVDSHWAAVMTDAWQAVPPQVRELVMKQEDPLDPTDSSDRLVRAVQILATVYLATRASNERGAT